MIDRCNYGIKIRQWRFARDAGGGRGRSGGGPAGGECKNLASRAGGAGLGAEGRPRARTGGAGAEGQERTMKDWNRIESKPAFGYISVAFGNLRANFSACSR